MIDALPTPFLPLPGMNARPSEANTPLEASSLLPDAPSFETVLAFETTRATQTQLTSDSNAAQHQAAAIQPRIGAPAQSFLSSALLVETAVSQRGQLTNDTVDAVQSAGAGTTQAPVSPVVEDVIAHVTETLDAWLREKQFLTAHSRHTLVIRPENGMVQADDRAGPGANALSPQNPAGASIYRTPGNPSGLPLQPQPAAELSGDLPAAQARPKSRPLATASGMISARIIPLDNGIRVILRLARIPVDIRTELETRLHEILQQFGFSDSDLLIHETGKA